MALKRVKSFIKQIYLKYKFAKDNIIEQNVIFSKGTVIEDGSFI